MSRAENRLNRIINSAGSGTDRLAVVRDDHVLGGVRPLPRKSHGANELRVRSLGSYRVGNGRGFYRDPMLHGLGANDRQFALT